MITIVSGLPRCGTSLMMQMLAAGGMPVLTDGERQADTDNPRGYYEWERIKQLPQNPTLIDEAEGRVVKCISQLLSLCPMGAAIKSFSWTGRYPKSWRQQAEMIRRRGCTGAADNENILIQACENHVKQVESWFNTKANLKVCRVRYHDVLKDPKKNIGNNSELFLQQPLNIEAMGAANRSSAVSPARWLEVAVLAQRSVHAQPLHRANVDFSIRNCWDSELHSRCRRRRFGLCVEL